MSAPDAAASAEVPLRLACLDSDAPPLFGLWSPETGRQGYEPAVAQLIADELGRPLEWVRAKKLGPDELKGGTFTITNPGVFGSLFGTPVINQPQVAILGIGAIEKRPMVMTDADGCDTIAIRVMSYFGITYDHRLVDGADADHFMNSVKKMLESDAWPELEPYL